jgi:rubrerythrin
VFVTSYTTILGQPQGIPLLFTNKIREALISEIDAINGYAAHILNSNMEEFNTAWRSIMGDEERHYDMFIALLRKYDPVQFQQYLQHKNDNPGIKTQLQTYKPEYDRQMILNNVREDIKGEFEAVILYEQHIMEIPYQEIKDVYYSVSGEEKGHAEHLTKLLLKYESRI